MPTIDLPDDKSRKFTTVSVKYTEYGTYKYFASFIVSLGQRLSDRPVMLIRMWANGSLIYDRSKGLSNSGGSWKFFNGDEDQGQVRDGMAYRGLMSVRFTDFALEKYGDQIPAISAEVVEGTGTTVQSHFGWMIAGPKDHLELFREENRLAGVTFQSGTVVYDHGNYTGYNFLLSLGAKSELSHSRFYGEDMSGGPADATIFAPIPWQNLIMAVSADVGKAQLYSMLTGQTSDPGIDTTATMALALWVDDGSGRDTFVVMVDQATDELQILYVNGTKLAFCRNILVGSGGETQTLARGPHGEDFTAFYQATSTRVNRYKVGAAGSLPSPGAPYASTLASDNLWTATGGQTLRQIWVNSSLEYERVIALYEEGGDYFLTAITQEGEIDWTSNAVTVSPDMTPREYTMEASSDLSADVLVLKRGSTPGQITIVYLVDGTFAETSVGVSGVGVFDMEKPIFWDSTTETIYDYSSYLWHLNSVDDDPGLGLDIMMTDLAIRAGYDESQVVTVNLDYKFLGGYVIAQETNLAQISNDLASIYGFKWSEAADRIIFKYAFDGGGAFVSDLTLTADELGRLSESGDSQVMPLEMSSEDSVPSELSLTYADLDNNYEPGFKKIRRSRFPVDTQSGVTKLALNLPITLTGTQAATLLSEMITRMAATKIGFSLRLPPQYIKLDATDAITWQNYGYEFSGVITEETLNPDNSQTYAISEVGGTIFSVEVETQEPVVPTQPDGRPIRPLVMDIPDRTTGQTKDGKLNLQVILAGFGEDTFQGGRLDFARVDQPTNLVPRVSRNKNQPGYGGVLTNGLVPVDEPFETDLVNVLRVDRGSIPEDHLVPATYDQMLAGANLIAVGQGGSWEYMQFGQVDIVDDDTVDLSYLFRGRFGTDVAVNERSPGDNVVLLNNVAIVYYPVPEYQNNQSYIYRGVGNGQDIGDALVQMVSPTGKSRKPYAPVNIQLVRQDSGDILVTWERRSRFEGEWEDDTGDVPLGELTEAYAVDIQRLDLSGTYRSNNVTSPSFVYTTADQTTDGTNDFTSLVVVVYQFNNSHTGRGFPGGGLMEIVDPNA